MLFGNSKRVVVVKDIPSNIIEEAIFILKSEPENNCKEQKSRGPTITHSKVNKDYLVKEAEAVINNYITQTKFVEQGTAGVTLKLSRHKDKKTLMTNIIINASMVASGALLIFVISRFF